ncbi:MAG TPA: beta-galactosidase [Ktedonobacterales bacterium]
MSNRTRMRPRMRQLRALRVMAREHARRTARRLMRQARIAWLVSLFGALLSACGGGAASSHSTPTSAPHASPTATTTYSVGDVRGAGVNVEPSYRPWRYLGGPAPESWWCQPPNCSPEQLPRARIDTDLQLARQLGVDHIRVEFPWRFIETQRGVYDWSRADLIVSEAQFYGVQLQPVVVYSPTWVGDPTAAPNPADFRDFTTTLVGRYHETISRWELWNEPDLDKYWSAGERAYVQNILIPGYQGVKAADPSALVILGGPSVASADWFNGIYQSGGGDSFDIMAWHVYGDVNAVLGSVNTALAVLSAHQQASKPLWIGEYGVEDSLLNDNAQSSLLTGVLTSQSAIAQADWYNLRDEASMECCPPTVAVMGHYGLVERDGVTRKSGFAALQRLISAGLPHVQTPQG